MKVDMPLNKETKSIISYLAIITITRNHLFFLDEKAEKMLNFITFS